MPEELEQRPGLRDCLKGTRIDILSKLDSHLSSETIPNVFWLYGVAGSGKSTVAMSLAQNFRNSNSACLGAHLIFQREKSKHSAVIRTLAFKLAMCDPAIALDIASVPEIYMDHSPVLLKTQFEELLLNPLNNSAKHIQGHIVIILDGLDECGSLKDRNTLMKILEDGLPKLPACFRIFILSRQEVDIDRVFSSHSNNTHMLELDHTSEVAKADVVSYIDVEMCKAVSTAAKNILGDQFWEDMLSILGDSAEGLFIWASTSVELVKYSTFPSPSEKLKALVHNWRSHKGGGVYRLYSEVLENRGLLCNEPETRDHFSRVLGLILFSKVALSIADIDALLGLQADSSSVMLQGLRCLLNYDPEARPSTTYLLLRLLSITRVYQSLSCS